MREKIAFSTNHVGTIDILMQKNEAGPLSQQTQKLLQNMVVDLNLRSRPIKFLGEKHRSKYYWPCVRQWLLRFDTKRIRKGKNR